MIERVVNVPPIFICVSSAEMYKKLKLMLYIHNLSSKIPVSFGGMLVCNTGQRGIGKTTCRSPEHIASRVESRSRKSRPSRPEPGQTQTEPVNDNCLRMKTIVYCLVLPFEGW